MNIEQVVMALAIRTIEHKTLGPIRACNICAAIEVRHDYYADVRVPLVHHAGCPLWDPPA